MSKKKKNDETKILKTDVITKKVTRITIKEPLKDKVRYKVILIDNSKEKGCIKIERELYSL